MFFFIYLCICSYLLLDITVKLFSLYGRKSYVNVLKHYSRERERKWKDFKEGKCSIYEYSDFVDVSFKSERMFCIAVGNY